MQRLRIAILGTGYWAQFQIAAWQAEGAEIVALWNRTRRRAEETAARVCRRSEEADARTGDALDNAASRTGAYSHNAARTCDAPDNEASSSGAPRVFDTPRQLFEWGAFDIADVITGAEAHEELVLLAAEHNKAVICQKPMSSSLASCDRMASACRKAGVWYAVHENFRYQPQILKAAGALNSGVIGRPLHAHLQLRSPDSAIMEKQPALKTMDHMALRDMGPHIFDVARFIFGEARSIYSRPLRCSPGIPVDDAAKSILQMESGLALTCDLVHTFDYKLYVEGEAGVLRLNADNTIKMNVSGIVRDVDVGAWPVLDYIPADDWALHGWFVFTALPLCVRALMERYRAGLPAETSGEDNLRTMKLVFAAIQSQDEDRVVYL